MYTVKALKLKMLPEFMELIRKIYWYAPAFEQLALIDDVIVEMQKIYHIPSDQGAYREWIRGRSDVAAIKKVYGFALESRQMIKAQVAAACLER